MGRTRWLAIVLAAALAVAACGGDDDDQAGEAVDGSAAEAGATSTDDDPDDTDADPETTVIEASTSSTLAGTTASTAASSTDTTASATTQTSASTTTSPSTTTEAPSSTTTETTATSTSGPVVDGGSSFTFTSPTGNIACVMGPEVSCWIGEKAWTIDQPDGPDCAISDWGNAVDLTADGPSFPCYTDMIWNVFAPPLDYGSAVTVGEYRCDSARSGVTCRNAAGRGFTVARASIDFF